MATIIAIFIFLLVIGLSINTVRAGENYNSSKSNTSTGIINRDVGNLLIDYGYGGEVVNRVTEALARGVTTDGLRAILGATSARSPAVAEEVLQKLEVELDRLGIRDTPQSAPATGTINIKDKNDGEASTPGTGDTPQPATVNAELHRPPTSATGKVIDVNPPKTQKGGSGAEKTLQENAKELRENFRENVRTTIGHVDHGKTGRIAVAHGKGLRMINRYRSAIARFDHILSRLESRVEKIRIETEAQARAKGKIKDAFPPTNIILLIEEAKNMSVENEAKLEELKAKYESLLLGKNPGGIAEEARAIAKELKSEIEKLHGLLGDIRQATGTINTTKSNTF